MDQDMDTNTRMFVEAQESGDAVERMLTGNRDAILTLADRMRTVPPRMIVTCARGSSDHAATYGKYLFETLLHIPVVSAAPSTASLFEAPARAGEDTLFLAVSQSGRSPDLLATVAAYRAAGAFIVAMVNDETSPLAEAADVLVALRAGPERSVAATKSCIAAMAAMLAIMGGTGEDPGVEAALQTLPERLRQAFAADWTPMIDGLATATNLFVIARGYGLGIAQEMALKLKETCALHAEAFSAAEVRHGPMTIVGTDFPILAIAGSDVAGDSVRSTAGDFAARGARVLLADAAGDAVLPAVVAHPAVEPILMLQSFYRAANALSLRRGLDPDAPPHLAKVTQTV